MLELVRNTSVICVDDEEGIIEAYRNTLLAGDESVDQLQEMRARRRQRMGGGEVVGTHTERQGITYNLFTASSGEEAVEIVSRELAAGQQIAAGFFDMSMPGGIDGPETIKRILELDNQMLCAIVTAYTDRSPKQLGNIFQRQDDWLYFNKPFSIGELKQTAYHLVTAWNQRRREEALISNLEIMQNGLLCILDTINDISQVPPMMVKNLLKGILKHFLKLLNSQDGFVSFLPDRLDKIVFGSGIFEKQTDSLSEMQSQSNIIDKVMKEQTSVVDKNVAAAPLTIGNKITGVLFVQADKPIEQNSELLDTYAFQATNMIQSSRLYEELDKSNIALTQKNQDILNILNQLTKSENLREQFEKLSNMDSLIEIPNRRYLEVKFNEELSRALRHDYSITCLMIDIDHFKKVNDIYGHAAGDYVLKESGRIFLASKRVYDVVGRYGGEEFVIVLSQMDPNEAPKYCERLRATYENHPFCFEGKRIKITVSIGFTTLKPSDGDTIETIFQKADEALYMAKNGGRNQCVSL